MCRYECHNCWGAGYRFIHYETRDFFFIRKSFIIISIICTIIVELVLFNSMKIKYEC